MVKESKFPVFKLIHISILCNKQYPFWLQHFGIILELRFNITTILSMADELLLPETRA